MLLEHLQESVVRASVRMTKIVAALEARRKEGKAIESYLKALRLLLASWKDEDPGKYGAHWYTFRNGRKVWPRELVDLAAVRAFDDKRAMGHLKLGPTPLADFGELDRCPCPSCEKDALEIGCYEQTEGGPHGDTWTQTRYALCAACLALYKSFSLRSDGRF